MKGNRMIRNLRAYLCVAMVLMTGQAALAAEFIAEYIHKQQQDVKTGRIYVKDGQYRLELSDPRGPGLILLVDADSNRTRILYPSYKIYQEMRCDDSYCCLNDPIQSAKAMLKFYSLTSEGYDRVAGYICDRQLIHHNGEGVMQRWTSEKLKFPLRIVTLGREDSFTELRNIKEIGVEASRFSVPADYMKATAEEVRARIANDPAIKARVSSHFLERVQTREITRLMAAGHEVRIVLAPGTLIKAKVRSGIGGPYKWYARPYRDGEPGAAGRPGTFSGPAEVDYKDIGQANTIVAGAAEGEVHLSLELTGKPPLVLATSERFYVADGSKRSWPVSSTYQRLVVSLIGDEGGEDGAKRARGKIIVSRKIPGKGGSKAAYDFVVNHGESQTLEFSADHGVTDFDLAVLEGKVEVSMLVDNREGQRSPASVAGIDWRDLLFR